MGGPPARDPSFRYARKSRLLTPNDFRTVFKRNIRSHDRYFTVLAHRSGEPARLGSAVARKACGSAVGRNRLKRIIRESFRHARERLPKVDIVVIVKPGAGKIANPQLRDSLEKHWQVITNKCER